MQSTNDDVLVNKDESTALIQQLQELTSVINSQIELDQEEREKNLELEKEEQLKLEEEQLLLIEQEEKNTTIQQEEFEDTLAFRESVLESMAEINENLILVTSAQTTSIELQKEVIGMYYETLPAVKQSADFSIFYLCLIPLFLILRWIEQMIEKSIYH